MPAHSQHNEILTHVANSRHLTHPAEAQGMYQGACLIHACAQLAYCNIDTYCKLTTPGARGSSTSYVLRRLPCPCPHTTDFKKMNALDTITTILSATQQQPCITPTNYFPECPKLHDIHKACTEASALS